VIKSPPRAARPTGRRPGPSTTRGQILAAARRRFAVDGFDRTSIRAVAAEAGVDPALVLHYFGSKDGLFSAAVEWPVELTEITRRVLAPGLDGLGERLVRFFLEQWEEERTRHPLTVLVRSAVGHEGAARLLAEFVRYELVGRLAAVSGEPAAELRGGLVASSMIGLALARYVVRLEPLASAPRETVVTAVAPTVQRYLTGDIGTGEAPASTTAEIPFVG